MGDTPDRLCNAELVIQLAAARGMLSESEARAWVQRLHALPAGGRSVKWLVEQGALTRAQARELGAAIHVAQGPTRNADGLPPVSDAQRPTAQAFPRVPGYEIVGHIGHGGMGVVFEAWQQRPSRRFWGGGGSDRSD